MNNTKFRYIVRAFSPTSHYIVELTPDAVNSITNFMNSIFNPEYAIGHRGTFYKILEPGYSSKYEAEEALDNLLYG